MNPLLYLYNELLWRPLFNGLVWLYTVLPIQDTGFAIIVLTIILRLILTPLLLKGQRAQKELAVLQPEIKRLQEQHKDNKETQGKALMELYAKHKVNPLSGCLLMLVQLPILIALFQVFQKGFDPSNLSYLYDFIKNPGALNPISFGVLDLSKGNIYLGILAAASQFLQTKMTLPSLKPASGKNDFSSILQWQTTYIFPALILVWSYSLPSALTLYWTVLNILGIVQEIIIKKTASRK